MIDKQLTIKDIASLAGVSTTTVSRFLNGKYEYMSEETRAQIQKVIDRVDYHPSAVARSMKSKKSSLIGIISTDMYVPEISSVLTGFCTALAESGYTPIIYNTNNDLKMEKECIRSCMEQAEGLIMRPTHKNFTVYNVLHARGLPVVLYDRFSPEWPFDAVYIDHYGAVRGALDHLHGQGFRDIHYTTDTANPMNTKMARRRAFLDFCEEVLGRSGEGYVHMLSPLGNPEQERGIIRKIMSSRGEGPKALFYDGAGNMKAILKALQEERVKIPDELGLCGYDHNGWAELMSPAVSAIVSPAYEMAYQAAKLLIARIGEKYQKKEPAGPAPYQRIVLQARFTPRASTVIAP